MSLRPDIINLLESSQIIAIQETHYSQQDLKNINSLHESFVGVGVSKINESDNIIQGSFSGGVAFLWRTELSKHIKQIKLDVNWCVAIEVSIESTKFVILNIYMPYQKIEHEDLYLEQLGYIKSFIDEMSSTNLAIVGDFNANSGLTGTKLFTNHLIEFCTDNDLIISSKLLLPSDSYTYVSSREGVYHYSWLDHIVSSKDFHKCIENVTILTDMSDEYHIPFIMELNIVSLPSITPENNEYTT